MLLGTWAVMGMGHAALVTPSGRLLRSSSNEADRPALFAAQFSLSHACWLLTYPLVGWLGAKFSLVAALWVMAAIALAGALAARWLWPRHDPEAIAHAHPELPDDHPHWKTHAADGQRQHAHEYVIDDYHIRWPGR